MLPIESNNNTAKLFDPPMSERDTSSSSSSSSSAAAAVAEQVVANDDLLTEILIHLPRRSLVRFESVSKHWLSLITSPHFARTRNLDPNTVSGLLLHPSSNKSIPDLDFIPLDDNGEKPSFESSTFFPGLSGINIINSCHGLILCQTKDDYHILNPSTKQFTTLPQPHPDHVGLSLAFDPSRSPHYKVVCVWCIDYPNDSYYQIEIYSSETGSWRASGEPFIEDMFLHVHGGVYWNGSINWFCTWGNSLYFNIDEERIGILPMLPSLKHDEYERERKCYVDSRGHLHLVQVYGPMTQFNVYEMERDYSGWFAKYQVDLEQVGIQFPEMMQRLPMGLGHCAYAILTLVRGEKDEDSFLVLHVAGKLIHYNLVDKTFRKICDVDHEGVIEGSLRYSSGSAFQYIESVSCV